ncbi:hypothetical protein BDW68DRAFT_3334 [Aspergillus falconensis]
MLFAIGQGNEDIVQLLLRQGDGYGVGTEIFFDALLYAARLGGLNIVSVLLDHAGGICVEPAIYTEYAARATSRGHDDIADLLLPCSLELDFD